MLEGVMTYYPAFSWNAEKGARAFDYTIASLRRKYMNLKVSEHGWWAGGGVG